MPLTTPDTLSCVISTSAPSLISSMDIFSSRECRLRYVCVPWTKYIQLTINVKMPSCFMPESASRIGVARSTLRFIGRI
jgi:hypothetical protein